MQALDSRSLSTLVARRLSAPESQVRSVILQYARRFFSEQESVPATDLVSPLWPLHLNRGQPCDVILMQAGISDLGLSSGKYVLPVSLATSILQCASIEASTNSASPSSAYSHLEDSLVKSFRALAPRATPGTRIFIPLCHARHWGLIVITLAMADNARVRAVVQWGDSLRRGPPSAVLHVVQSVLKNAYSIPLCTVDDTVDYMLDVHKFARQTDSFSSGFYVIALFSIIAYSTQYLPRRPLHSYNLEHIEDVRDACAASFCHHLYTLHLQQPSSAHAVRHRDVFQFLLRCRVNPPRITLACPEVAATISDLELYRANARQRSNLNAVKIVRNNISNATDILHDHHPGTNPHTQNRDDTEAAANISTASNTGNHDDTLADDGNDPHRADALDDVDAADDPDASCGVDDVEKPKVTELVYDIVTHFQRLASQGFFFGNTSHQGLKGRSGRGQLYRAYIQLRCIKYPGDRKRNIPKCKAKLRYDKLRDSDGWHASLFAEHSHPPLPEKLRSRRESQVIQTLRDVQMWYLPRHLLPRPTPNLANGKEKSIDDNEPKAAEKILPRPPHLNPDGQSVRPILISHVHPSKPHVHPSISVLPAQPGPLNVAAQACVASGAPQLSTHNIQSQQHPQLSMHHPSTQLALHLTSQPLLSMQPTQPQSFNEQQSHSPPHVIVASLHQNRSAVPIAPRETMQRSSLAQSIQLAAGASQATGFHAQHIIPHPAPPIPGNNQLPPRGPTVSLSQPTPMSNSVVPDSDLRGLPNNNSPSTMGIHQNGQESSLRDDMHNPNVSNISDERQGVEDVEGTDADGEVPAMEDPDKLEMEVAPEPMDDVFRTNGEDLMPLRDGGASLALVEAIRAYVGTAHMKLAENEMAQHIKRIAEQCGYKLRIRRSMYHAGQENVFIKSATFECAQKVRNGCPFAFRLRGHLKRRRSSDSSGGNSHSEDEDKPQTSNKQAVYTTTVQFLNQVHNHEHDHTLLRKHIQQPDVPKTLIRLARADGMTVGNVIRHVEKNHSFMVPRTPLRKKIIAERQIKDPLAQQCNALASHLMTIKNELPNTFVHFAPEGRRKTLSRICWSFAEWQEDYMLYGRVPGVYIDTDELAEQLKLPLVSINGRTNSGSTVTFFVSFIAEKSEESYMWMLEQFKQCMSRGEVFSPKILVVEDCQATIMAARKHFPSTWVFMDAHSVVKKEKENVTKFLASLDMSHLFEEMSSRLSLLRECHTHEDFTMARKSFESTFFSKLDGNKDQPSWYKRIYYDEKELVIRCFNRTCCGLHFLFEGADRAQTFDSLHKLVAGRVLVESSEVPELLQNAVLARKAIEDAPSQENDAEAVELLTDQKLWGSNDYSGLGLQFARIFTGFCLKHLEKFSLSPSDRWKVRSCSVEADKLDRGETVKIAVFQVAKSDEVDDGDEVGLPRCDWEVSVFKRLDNSGTTKLESYCECGSSKMSGIPCTHQITVFRAFNDGGNQSADAARTHLGTSSLPLSDFVHEYWRRDNSRWADMILTVRNESRASQQTDGNSADRVASTGRIRATLQAGVREWQNHLTYAANKAVFDRAWSAVEVLGKDKKEMFHSALWQLVSLCRQQRVPDARKLAAASQLNGVIERGSAGGSAGESLLGMSDGTVVANSVGRGEKRILSNGLESLPQKRRVDSGNVNGGSGADFGTFGSGGIFSNELGPLGDDSGQRTGFGNSVVLGKAFSRV